LGREKKREGGGKMVQLHRPAFFAIGGGEKKGRKREKLGVRHFTVPFSHGGKKKGKTKGRRGRNFF